MDRKKTKFTCDLVSVGACPLQRHIINPSIDGGGGGGLLGPKPTEITHRLDLGLRSCWVDTHRLIRNSALFYFCLLPWSFFIVFILLLLLCVREPDVAQGSQRTTLCNCLPPSTLTWVPGTNSSLELPSLGDKLHQLLSHLSLQPSSVHS